MRIKLEFVSGRDVVLPTGYYKYLQALVYNFFSNSIGRFIHEKGFENFGNRVYKFFCFSSPLERAQYDSVRKTFNFGKEISFYVASPIDWIMEDILRNSLTRTKFELGRNRLYLTTVTLVSEDPIKSRKIEIKALTPIEVHSTVELNGKKTIYYSPFEREFKVLVNKNLQHKWEALRGEECPYELHIEPLFTSFNNKRIVYYGFGKKRFLIEGWVGNYLLEGEPEFLNFAYNVALGSRNSQGFGFIDLVREYS